LSSGSQQYDFAYIDDHVMAFLLAATVPLRPGWSVYNIGGGVPRLLREVVEAVAECIGTAASDRLHFSARPTDDDGLAVCGDISAARRELGYVPATPLRTGIARTVRWWRESAASRAVS
jgi:nucleoside-diphosphate-sugar epimerase